MLLVFGLGFGLGTKWVLVECFKSCTATLATLPNCLIDELEIAGTFPSGSFGEFYLALNAVFV